LLFGIGRASENAAREGDGILLVSCEIDRSSPTRASSDFQDNNCGNDGTASPGQSMADAVRVKGVIGVTYDRWRQEFGRPTHDRVKRLKDRDAENAWLGGAVANLDAAQADPERGRLPASATSHR